jgi:putative membrane protein
MHGWWWDGGMGWGAAVGLIFMLVFWGLIIAGVVLIVRSLTGRRDEGAGSYRTPPYQEQPRPSALEVLQERYARGEIERDEYLRRKADLES